MNIYLLMFDAQIYYVEATSFTDAVDKWKGHVKKLWGKDYDGTEEPESCTRVHDEPFIR